MDAEFQKQSRVGRSNKQRAHVTFWEKSKKGGPHEDKVGKHANRQRQNRLSKRDIENALNGEDE